MWETRLGFFLVNQSWFTSSEKVKNVLMSKERFSKLRFCWSVFYILETCNPDASGWMRSKNITYSKTTRRA